MLLEVYFSIPIKFKPRYLLSNFFMSIDPQVFNTLFGLQVLEFWTSDYEVLSSLGVLWVVLNIWIFFQFELNVLASWFIYYYYFHVLELSKLLEFDNWCNLLSLFF